MIGDVTQVVGAGKPDVLVAASVEFQEGLVLRLAKARADIRHVGQEVVQVLHLPRDTLTQDAKGHLGIVERLPPTTDHLREHGAIHRGSPYTTEAVVVPLVEDGALDGQSGDR